MTEQEPFWLEFFSNIIKNINDSRAAVNSSLVSWAGSNTSAAILKCFLDNKNKTQSKRRLPLFPAFSESKLTMFPFINFFLLTTTEINPRKFPNSNIFTCDEQQSLNAIRYLDSRIYYIIHISAQYNFVVIYIHTSKYYREYSIVQY